MKKKIYNQPRVETMQMVPGTVVLAGSPGKGIGAGTGNGTTGDIIGGGEGPIGGN